MARFLLNAVPQATTDRALALLEQSDTTRPLFLWVHYFDPHDPYQPPAPFDAQYESPYLGEIAAMDHHLGRLAAQFERTRGGHLVVVGDHGEGLGEEGEALHGHLLQLGVARVPMLHKGPGISPAPRDSARSVPGACTRPAAGTGRATNVRRGCARRGDEDRSFNTHGNLGYGCAPLVMSVTPDEQQQPVRILRFGAGEEATWERSRGHAGSEPQLMAPAEVPEAAKQAINAYPLPGATAANTQSAVSAETQERLAALGYTTSLTPHRAKQVFLPAHHAPAT